MIDLPDEVEEVRVLRLQPGDVIVAKVSHEVTLETAKVLKANLESVFPGYRVIVFSGLDLEVARSAATEIGTWTEQHDSRDGSAT